MRLRLSVLIGSIGLLVILLYGCKSTEVVPFDAYWEGDGGFAQLQGDVFRYNDSYWKVTYETNDSIRVWPLQHDMHMTVKFDRKAAVGEATKLYFRQDTIKFTIDAVRSTPPDSLHLPYYLDMAYKDSVCMDGFVDGKWVDERGIIWWFSNAEGARNEGIYQLVHFKPGTKEFKEFIVMTTYCDTMHLMLETAKAIKYQLMRLDDRQMAVVLKQDGIVTGPVINLIKVDDQGYDLTPYFPRSNEVHIKYLQDSTLVPTLTPVKTFDTIFDLRSLQWKENGQ